MTKISEIQYIGELRTRCTHLRSGESFITDAPTDNKGKGQAFSPTDTLATSLGTCMITVMGIAANERGWPFSCHAEIEKYMASNPRRVERIKVLLHIKDEQYSDHQKKILEQTGLNCPVAKSLSDELIQDVEFRYY